MNTNPKTLLITTHSVGTLHEKLAEITVPVMKDYCQRHGYGLAVMKCDYDKAHIDGLINTMEQLKEYDIVATFGADVLITNHSISIQDIHRETHHIFSPEVEEGIAVIGPAPLTISRECLGWWPINNDVSIWCPSAIGLIRRLLNDREIWCKYRWLWQHHLWNLMQTENWNIEVAAPRVLQSTHQPGLSRWQLGDFALHLLDMPDAEKINLAKFYLQFVGDGTFIPLEPINT